ncbi:DUF7848 domain-containing protein [Streptomyces sp. NBC_00322]|uniref:DUF7848 domain-containing protein n=1 Tax=Streptomyces sp. NBC_00322 TaxID=2975712 RepID=UPI003FA68E1A
MDGTRRRQIEAVSPEDRFTKARAVMRFADWTLSADKEGSGPIFIAECTTCDESSDAAENKADPEVWCLRHAGALGHTGFRGITTAYFRATPVEPSK